ncbi:MAG: signal peptidase I [Enterococcus sp.]
MRKHKFSRETFWLVLKYFILALGIAFLIRGFLFIPVPVEGNSMEATLEQGDMILMEKITRIDRFDVVVFRLDNGTTYIKRVIGLPGETIAYKADQLYVNGEPIEEDFLDHNRHDDHAKVSYTNDFTFQDLTGETHLGADQYFVLGDNRRVSKDSRSFGAISSEEIIGKAQFVYYPFRHMQLIRD